jgi:MurNAc alpha-1-phosphate uridylyltransferase
MALIAGMDKAKRFPDVMLLSSDGSPDPMELLAGLPLAERLMRLARTEGATRMLANASDASAAPLLAHFGGLVKVSRDQDSATTGDMIRTALPQIVSDPFLVLGMDALWRDGADTPLTRLTQRERQAGEIVILCVQPSRARGVRRSHDFCLDPAGQVTRDYGAPVLFGGAALLDRTALARMGEDGFSLDALFELALEEERLFGAVLDADWFNLRSPEGRAAAEEAMAS